MAKPRAKKPKAAAVLDPWAEAVLHIRKVDASWAKRVELIGPCLLKRREDRFGTLVRAIIGQQISTTAARSIDQRVKDLCGDPHDPAELLAVGEEGLRSCGLSGVKARYVLNLSRAVQDGSAPLDQYDTWTDEEVSANLTAIKGIGAWTAEMFLIFALGRPDVLSTGDLGIRVGMKNHFGLEELPGPKQCRELMEPLRPYRSVAMWYLWEEIDNPRRT